MILNNLGADDPQINSYDIKKISNDLAPVFNSEYIPDTDRIVDPTARYRMVKNVLEAYHSTVPVYGPYVSGVNSPKIIATIKKSTGYTGFQIHHVIDTAAKMVSNGELDPYIYNPVTNERPDTMSETVSRTIGTVIQTGGRAAADIAKASANVAIGATTPIFKSALFGITVIGVFYVVSKNYLR